MTNIEDILESEKFILSGNLAAMLVKADGISSEAARKRIERVKTPVHKVTGLFADNQSFLYHSDYFGSGEYFESLNDALSVAGKRCAAIINAITYHHGLISKNELANYSFSPIINIKGHVTFSTLIQKLKKIGIIQDYDNTHYQLIDYLHGEPNLQHFKAIQFSKNLLTNHFRNWSRNIGLASFKAGKVNSNVSGFQFAFTAPSYIQGFVHYKEGAPQPGFLVADVLIGNSTKEKDINFFLQKIAAIRASNKTIRLFPVLIVDGVEPEALKQLKQAGVMIGTIREIFGEAYNDLLKDLINTVTNAGTILKKDPEKYINLMTQLTKLVDGKTNNLRGDLFELAVGYYFGQFCKFLEIGKKVSPSPGEKRRDIDVLAIYENEVRIVECKGYNYAIDEEYIDRYLSDIIPSIHKWANDAFKEKQHIYEIWSTGGFTDGAVKNLEEAGAKTKKYQIVFCGKEEILNKAGELQTSKFADILKEYYFKEIA